MNRQQMELNIDWLWYQLDVLVNRAEIRGIPLGTITWALSSKDGS
ncbi:MAG: hypothetical protein VYD76_07875 [Pseudomonadota bacterium]|nr:hypothetical protein [Pseudomonadota bacterium]